MDGTLTDRPTGVELFRRWVMDLVPAPPAECDVLSDLDGYEPEDVPAMIDVLRQAELACLTGLNEFNRRTHAEREQAQAQDHDPRARVDMSMIVRTEIVERWHGRITWLQDVRQYLEREQRREGVAASSRGGVVSALR